MTLPGGWIADRILGQQRSILYGGIIIMFGHFLLAMPNGNVFYLGLSFVVIGTGLLKPNISEFSITSNTSATISVTLNASDSGAEYVIHIQVLIAILLDISDFFTIYCLIQLL